MKNLNAHQKYLVMGMMILFLVKKDTGFAKEAVDQRKAKQLL